MVMFNQFSSNFGWIPITSHVPSTLTLVRFSINSHRGCSNFHQMPLSSSPSSSTSVMKKTYKLSGSLGFILPSHPKVTCVFPVSTAPSHHGLPWARDVAPGTEVPCAADRGPRRRRGTTCVPRRDDFFLWIFMGILGILMGFHWIFGGFHGISIESHGFDMIWLTEFSDVMGDMGCVNGIFVIPMGL